MPYKAFSTSQVIRRGPQRSPVCPFRGPSGARGARPGRARRAPQSFRVSAALGAHKALKNIKWTATGVPVFDRLATLGPGYQSVSLAAQLIGASILAAYALKLVADSWMKRMRRSNEQADLRVSGTRRKSSLTSILLQSAVPVVSNTIPLLALSYSVTVLFSLLAVYEVHLRNMFYYTFVDEGLVVRAVLLLSQFSQDVVDTVLIYSTTLFVRNIKDILVKRYLVKSITDGQFGEGIDGPGIRGNVRPLVRLVNVANVLINYILYLIAFIASLDAFGFDVGPLVASISGLSVLIGIGMREVLENIAGAITLYLAPPFDVGDRVRLITADGVDTVQPVVEGVVEEVGVLRTVVQTETSRFYLANAMLLRLVVERIRS